MELLEREREIQRRKPFDTAKHSTCSPRHPPSTDRGDNGALRKDRQASLGPRLRQRRAHTGDGQIGCD